MYDACLHLHLHPFHLSSLSPYGITKNTKATSLWLTKSKPLKYVSRILSLAPYGKYISKSLNWLKWRLVIRVNSNGLNLMSTPLTQNHNWFLTSPLKNYLNTKEYTNTPLNLMSQRCKKFPKHILSNNLDCFLANVDLIMDIGFLYTYVVTFTQKSCSTLGNLNSPPCLLTFCLWNFL